MMKSICVIALAGIVGVSQAEDFSLSLSGADKLSAAAGIYTIDVFGDSTFGTHMLGGGFSLVSDSPVVSDITWTPASWSAFNEDGGYLGNGNYGQVVFGQLLLPIPGFDTPAAGSELGGLIGTFHVVYALTDVKEMDFELVASSPFTLETVDVNNGLQAMQDVDGTLSLGSLHAAYVPSPSGIGFFALAGLAAARRRRV